MKEFDELRSEAVQEVLSQPPSWLLRSGITAAFIIVLIILIGSYLVRYPDIIKASVNLTTSIAPKAVPARISGKLMKLFINEGEEVEEGDLLAFMESIAVHEEVLRLLDELNKLQDFINDNGFAGMHLIGISNFQKLGELQSDYQIFSGTLAKLQTTLNSGFYSEKRKLLLQEVADLQKLDENLKEQSEILEQDVHLSQEDYSIQLQLAQEEVIAPLELRQEHSRHLARQLPYKQILTSIINNRAVLHAKQKEILELEIQVQELYDNFSQSLNTLQSAAKLWKTQYVITAPIDGYVHFPSIFQENEYIDKNQELFYVDPAGSDYHGVVEVPQQNFGKVKIGQEVLLKFPSYPFQEFGIVKGKIASISEVAVKDDVFLAKVIFPDGLKTSYGESVSFKTGMIASAEIITEDVRLIERIFYQLRLVMERQ